METNANWSTISTGSDASSAGGRENESQRQVRSNCWSCAPGAGGRENESQRQARGAALESGGRAGGRENESQRQGAFFKTQIGSVSADREEVLRRYTFKLYPNKSQSAAMQRQAALLALLWNAALEQREAQWAQQCQRMAKGERRGLSFYDQSKDVKHIRAYDPEFAAMSADTPPLCLQALDDAFKAFFKRAKAGAGKSSGYPKYKSVYAIENKGANCTIWHRDMPKGWRLEKSGGHFKVYAKGLADLKDRSTWIRARGRFPVDMADLTVRDMRLMRVGGTWYCSIVARMAARREKDATDPKAKVEFNLIDEFASVKGANGECLPGWETGFSPADEQISPAIQGVKEAASAEASEMGSDGRYSTPRSVRRSSAEASDEIQSQGDARFKRGSYRWRQERRRVAKRKAREARQRKEALHLWTTRLIGCVSELTAVCPPIRENTKSAKGNARNHGAAVKTVAMLNRHVLAQAPAMALQMLEYKAKEAGIQFTRVSPEEHNLAAGQALVAATKAVRSTRRSVRIQKELTHV